MARILRIFLLSTALLSAAGFATWQGSRVSAAFSRDMEATAGRSGTRAGARGPAAAEDEVLDVTMAEVSVMQPVSIAYGRISAPRRVDVGAAVSGEVVFVMEGLRDGASVSAGDVLFGIDDAEASTALREAEITEHAAEAALANDRRRVSELTEELALLEEKLEIAQAELERTRPLVDRGLSGVATLDAARSSELSARQELLAQTSLISAAENEVAQGEIAVEQTSLAVERAERALADHQVVAPIGGVFSGSAPLAGQSVMTTAIGEIVELTYLEAHLELSQAALSRVTGADGQVKKLEVEIRRPSGDARATARLDRLAIDASSDGSGSSVAIVPLLAEHGVLLRPGDFVEARIFEDVLNGVVALPTSAVSPEGQVAFVDGDGRIAFEEVAVVRRVGGEIFVDDAIAGRSYVVAPGADLADGQTVVAEGDEAAVDAERPATGRRGTEGREGAEQRAGGGGQRQRGTDAPAAADQGEI